MDRYLWLCVVFFDIITAKGHKTLAARGNDGINGSEYVVEVVQLHTAIQRVRDQVVEGTKKFWIITTHDC